LVDQGSLAETAGHANVKFPKSSPLQLFKPARTQFAPAGMGGSMMFASRSGSGGSGRGGDDHDDYDYQDDDPQNSPQPAPRSRMSRTSGGAGGTGDSGGRQRTVQFQSDERYWTEYLRIALPVIGLLLMLGLFWYWAQQLIDSDSNTTEPVATEQAPGNVAVITPTAQLPTTAPTVNVAAGTPPPSTTGNQTGGQATETVATGNPQPTSAPQATTAPTQAASSGSLAIGSTATINNSGVNLRPDASTTGTALEQLNNGDVVTIVAGPTNDGTYTWWQVTAPDGQTGWVVDTYLTPGGGQ
jgi:hypothetical protein